MNPEVSPGRRPVEGTPDPGKYDSHLKPFGADIKNKVDFGSKYDFKVNDVPPPGRYDPSHNITKSKT